MRSDHVPRVLQTTSLLQVIKEMAAFLHQNLMSTDHYQHPGETRGSTH